MSLSALSIDLVVALGQRPLGAGTSELARIVQGPATSVQSALRQLATHGIVSREGTRYSLEGSAAGAAEIERLGLRFPQPMQAIRLVLRANEAVELVVVDGGGFIVGERRGNERATEVLNGALAEIRRDRADPPVVLRFETGELSRIVRSAIGLRTRVGLGEVVKGTVRWVAGVLGA